MKIFSLITLKQNILRIRWTIKKALETKTKSLKLFPVPGFMKVEFRGMSLWSTMKAFVINAMAIPRVIKVRILVEENFLKQQAAV